MWFTEEFYQHYTLSHLGPVLDTLRWLRQESNVWVELTNLVIPGANDDKSDLERMCGWIVEELGDVGSRPAGSPEVVAELLFGAELPAERDWPALLAGWQVARRSFGRVTRCANCWTRFTSGILAW